MNTLLPASAALVGIAAVAGHALGFSERPFATYAFHLVAAPSYLVLGGLILSQRRQHMIGSLFAGIGVCSAVVALGASFGSYPLMAWMEQAFFLLPIGLIAFVFLFFPEGRLPSRAWRPVGWITALSLGVSVLTLGWAAWRAPRVLLDLSAATSPSVDRMLQVAGGGMLVLLICVVLAIGSLVARWRSSEMEVRQQIKVLTIGSITIPIGIIVNFFFGVPIMWASVGLVVPAAITTAILKYRLYDIDLIINRSLVYAILSALVIGGYAGLVTIVAPFFDPGDSHPASLLATAVVALLFQPVRGQVQKAVNRLLYGDRDDPYAVVSRLIRRLEEAADSRAILPQVVRTVAEGLQLPYSAIELANGETVARYGRPAGEPTAYPMIHHGRAVGRLLASPRSAAASFTAAESRLLQDLATQTGLTAYAVQLTHDLQRSRERLVRSREEERLRLRRDLHDGLGPALAGMTMQVGAARTLLRTDTDRVEDTLSHIEKELQVCLTEIRRVVDDLRPPELDQLGLVEAVRARAEAFHAGQPDLQIPVNLQGSADLPAAVEVAAYRIVTEAVTNTVRHAKAHRCDVQLTTDRTMIIEVCDDGVGLPEPIQPGVGLASMRDRAEELGGTFTATRRPTGGTRIRAEIPLAMP